MKEHTIIKMTQNEVLVLLKVSIVWVFEMLGSGYRKKYWTKFKLFIRKLRGQAFGVHMMTKKQAMPQ